MRPKLVAVPDPTLGQYDMSELFKSGFVLCFKGFVRCIAYALADINEKLYFKLKYLSQGTVRIPIYILLN